MTIDVSNNNPRIEYAVAQGAVQTVFAVPFEFFEDSDLSVYVDGTAKVLGADYTLTGGDGSVGTLTFVTATPPDVQQVTGASGGSTVVIARHVSLERVTDFVAGQEINRAALNTQLDTIVAQIADLDDKVSRTIHLTDSEVPPSMLLTSDRKGRVLAFDSVTGDVEAGPLSNDIQIIADNISEILAADDEAAAAAASATAAAASASAGASSASAAASSAASASASETAAETAQAAAATSATNAATSETNASTSASTASTKASEAATYATNAATSATEAETAKTGAETARDAALAALDSFDDRYLGVKTSDPTVDNDGDALAVGAIYFNSTTDLLYVYNGTSWQVTANAASGDLVSTNNLSDLTSPATARTNLGLGTAATTASTDYATAAQGTLADSAVQPNDSPTFAGLTTTANVSFGDNDKAIFGAGSDLQIFHSGTASWIRDLGTGGLVIDTDGTTIDIKGSSPTEYMARFIKDGAVSLYYDNAAKLATTSTGIDVSGKVTADGLTVDGDATIGQTSGGDRTLSVGSAGALHFDIDTEGTTGRVYLNATNDNTAGKIHLQTADLDRLFINNNGDISFYEDTGSQAKFFWDSSAESLKLGHATTVFGDNELDLVGDGNGVRSGMIWMRSGTGDYVHQINVNGSTLEFGAGGALDTSPNVSIDSSGNVGIGTTSPSQKLDVVGTVKATSFSGDGSSLTGIAAGAGGGGNDEIFWENGQNVTANYTITNGKNAMSAGPITINSGVTVTVGDGETWTVI